MRSASSFYGGPSFAPPEEIQRAARRALALMQDGKAGSELSDVTRSVARQLATGASTPRETVKRMNLYFSKHKGDRSPGWATRGGETAPYVAHLAHGGEEGRKWAARLMRSIDILENSVLFDDERYLAASETLASTSGYEPADTVSAIDPSGAKFVIQTLIPEGKETGDGRIFEPLSVTTRDLPIPLLWQMKTSDGHDGSVLVGRIDTVKRIPGGLGEARGVFDTGSYGREAERLVRMKFLRGVSADLDQFDADQEDDAETGAKGKDKDEDSNEIKKTLIRVKQARVMAATLLPKPAFQECTIAIDDEEPTSMIPDGEYIAQAETSDSKALVACALVASRVPVHPPRTWFEDQGLKGPTPLTVTDEGQVFGHIAGWIDSHIGLPFPTKPPRSFSNYRYFHTGALRTDEGDDVYVGQLTLAGGHAPLTATADEAVRHYDDTSSGVADVHVGEDIYGIWAAGALRPSVTPEQVRVLRASAPSGDWRPINGRLELVAVCQVNVPGFPVARAQVASGQVYALVAAGWTPALAQPRPDIADELAARVASLESDRRRELTAKRDALAAKVHGPVRAKAADLSARFHALAAEDNEEALFKDYSSDTREDYVKKGWAMKGGRYPIANPADLKRAIRAYGRGEPSDKPAIKRHIKKRARALGKTDLIPESWALSSQEELAADKNELVARVYTLAIDDPELPPECTPEELAYRFQQKFEETRHPRDPSGRWRKVLFRLRSQLEQQGDLPEHERGAIIARIDSALDASDRKSEDEAKKLAEDVLHMTDDVANGLINPDIAQTLKQGNTELAEAIAAMRALPFGQEAEKLRFTDLPMPLQNLIQELLGKLETQSQELYDKHSPALVSYMAGGDYMSQPEIQAELTKILSLLI